MKYYGRVQVAEPLSALGRFLVHDETATLTTSDHEPKVAVLDQSDLRSQGIRCSTFIPGARDVDGLGSCTANATTAALSNVLPDAQFFQVTGATAYTDTVGAEKFAITFYHECTDQTGDPGSEWPPTDCGSSGPYITSELQRLGLVRSDSIAAAAGVPQLLQTDGVLMGSPWFYAWEEPGPNAFLDGDGSPKAIRESMASGVAGGHETYLSALETVAYDDQGRIDPQRTVIRGRNSWSASWGDHGSYRLHLSTLIALGHYCDFRQLVA